MSVMFIRISCRYLVPLDGRAAVPLYHVGERVSVQMSVCAPVPHKMVEGCIVKENSGRIPAASPVRVSMFTAESNNGCIDVRIS